MMLRAFHGRQEIKDKYLARVRAHRLADEIVQRIGWDGRCGCAVGCTLDMYSHARYPVELGIPVVLAHLEDAIHEALPHHAMLAWPERFLAAIEPGADLAPVWPRWARRALADDDHGIANFVSAPELAEAIRGVARTLSEPQGTDDLLRVERQIVKYRSALIGDYNAYNAIEATVTAIYATIDDAAECAGLMLGHARVVPPQAVRDDWTRVSADRLVALLGEAAP